MCWGDRTPPPSGSSAGTNPPGCTTAPCPAPPCPFVEIEINNTPATNDDLVRIKCEHPAGRSLVNCRIRATGSPANDATIVLTNPDGRLRFPNVGDTTTTVTVPRSGAWVPFQISGEAPSAAIGDAVIQAHCNTADGELKGTKAATVFWFDQAQLTITTPGSYAFVSGKFTTTGGPAAHYAAKARIRPEGVDCSAPQVVNLRIGLMQESSNFQSTTTWGNPTVAWAPGVPSGVHFSTPTTITATTAYAASVTQPVADTDSAAAPVYDRPAVTTTLDANSLQKPIGCQSGGGTAEATSFDSPAQGAPATKVRNFSSGATPVATVTYTRTNATRQEHFRTFCVVLDTSTNSYCALRQATWDVNVDSSGMAPQKASAAADGPVTADPATGANANEVSQPTVTSESGTTNFTKP
jgi:hypothetical protein